MLSHQFVSLSQPPNDIDWLLPMYAATVLCRRGDNLPSPAAGVQWWGPMAFNAIDGKHAGATFDAPRQPVWRQGDN